MPEDLPEYYTMAFKAKYKQGNRKSIFINYVTMKPLLKAEQIPELNVHLPCQITREHPYS